MLMVCQRSSCPVAWAALYVVLLLLGGGSDKIQINSVDGFAPRPKIFLPAELLLPLLLTIHVLD